MKIPEDVYYTLTKGDLEEKYAFFRMLAADIEEMQEAYPLIRHGIKHKFDIYEVLENKFKDKGSSMVLRSQDMEIPIEEYRTEIEERDTLMIKLIYEHGVTKGLFDSRT